MWIQRKTGDIHRHYSNKYEHVRYRKYLGEKSAKLNYFRKKNPEQNGILSTGVPISCIKKPDLADITN